MIERTSGSTVTTGFPLYDAHGNDVATLGLAPGSDKLDCAYLGAVLAATNTVLPLIEKMTSAAVMGARSRASVPVVASFTYGMTVLSYLVANEADNDSSP